MGTEFRHYVLARPAPRAPRLDEIPALLERLSAERLMPPWTFMEVSTYGRTGSRFVRTMHLDILGQELAREGIEELSISQELAPRTDRLFQDTALVEEWRRSEETVGVSLLLHRDYQALTMGGKAFAADVVCARCGTGLELEPDYAVRKFYELSGAAVHLRCPGCGGEVDAEQFGATGAYPFPQEMNPGVVPAFRFGLCLDFGKGCPWADDFDDQPLANPLVQQAFLEVLGIETVQFRWADG